MSTIGWPIWPVSIAVQLTVAVLLLGSRLTPRNAFGRRLCAVLATTACVALIPSATGLIDTLDSTSRYLEQFFVFCGVLALLVLAVRLLFDANTWAALFCATTAYTMQNLASSAEQLARMVLLGRAQDLDFAGGQLFSLATMVLSYSLCYLGFIRKIDRSALERMRSRTMIGVYVVVAFAVIGFDLVVKSACNEGLTLGTSVLLRVAHVLACVFVLVSEYEILYVQQLRVEKATTERLLAERGRQYELARGNIEAINVKCHDIKHQIRTLSSGGRVADPTALADLAHEVAIYDSSLRTGNEALDTILTEKGLICERRGITLSCIVDGSSLSFVAPSDLYAFFGNALDNAIEAVSAFEGLERRTVSLVVKRRGSMVTIHEENYCANQLRFLDGTPQTTKPDAANHGFGVRSMRLIAEKYDGSLTVSCEQGIFRLDAVIPVAGN